MLNGVSESRQHLVFKFGVNICHCLRVWLGITLKLVNEKQNYDNATLQDLRASRNSTYFTLRMTFRQTLQTQGIDIKSGVWPVV